MATLEEKVDKILSYIEDDPSTGREGLYKMLTNVQSEVKDLEGRVKDVEEKQKYVLWKVGGTGITIGGAFIYILKLLGILT